MSIRKYFDKEIPYKLFSETPENIRKDAESMGNLSESWENKSTFIPQVDFADPANFVKYGSAESYYQDAISRIYENYPYDGSSQERQEYLNESTYLDRWMLEYKYPRTTGFINISATGWGAVSTAPGPLTSYYGEPATKEYITFFGGPHTASDGMNSSPLSTTFENSNKFEANVYSDAGFTGTGTRESNLKADFDNGVTIEFWLRKPEFNNNNTEKEVIFDLWNSASYAPLGSPYGRILLQLTGTAANSPFVLSIQSGTAAPFEEEVFGSTLTTASLETFGHYAFRVYNSGSGTKVDFFNNGNLLETKFNAATTTGEITGALHATLGALTSPAIVASSDYAGKGWGKLSGSLDEFRFWKTKKTSEDIGRHWFTQVYGGANTDIANTDLGVYYKFNEGITGDATIDSTVLDYSGRISNGTWTNYTAYSRNVGSAMIIASASQKEFKDPIIYVEHPEVAALITEMNQSGSNYDYQNSLSLYNSVPTWIIDEDEATGQDFKRLTQIMSSFLDTLYLQINELNKIKDIGYVDPESKELPFASQLLEGYGFVAPEIFADATLLNQIFDRAENKEFSDSVIEIKDTIYKNIYNNIVSIYKSKGTARAFRNLVRCYGIDESLVKINAYASNVTYDLKEDRRYTSVKKNFIDFYKTDNFYGSIYQQTSSSPLSTSFISASQGTLEDYTSFTLEAETLFPFKKARGDYDYYSTPFNTSSLFGFHTADPSTPTDLAWASTDYDVQVYAVMPPTNGNSSAGYFLVTSSYYGIEEKSSIVEDMYFNKRWNLSLTLAPTKEGGDLVSGSAGSYTLKLYAVSSYSDVIQDEVTLETEITSNGAKLLNEPKRIYAGSHRQDFTGSIIHGSDVKLGSVRYWMKELSNTTIQAHAQDADNFGSRYPERNVHNFATSLDNVEIPEIETLALFWAFDQVTGSDAGSGSPTVADAGFFVEDLSSGSSVTQSKYGWMGNVLGSIHSGRGDFFYPNTTNLSNQEFVPSAKQENPEVVSADNTVKVFNLSEQEVFTKQTRPSTFMFMAEKSMYDAISSEIINYFATILDFNNLIGDPVNRYRQAYKSLDKLRSLFFAKVENEPDVERYIEYYKWIDDSLGTMLMELFPASADKQDGLRNVIESHVLERNKYWNKYPTLDLKKDVPITGIRGINELTYDWQFGHHPVDDSQDKSCFWWKERAERDKPPLSSSVGAVNTDKEAILSVTLNTLNRKYSTPVKYTVKREDIITGGSNKDNNIRENVKKSVKFGESSGILVKSEDVGGILDCTDDSGLGIKQKIPFKAENQLDSNPYMSGPGSLLMPFTAITSSVTAGYQKAINDSFKLGFGIENLHIDSYVGSQVPMQGPFTEKHVGGNEHRHIKLNEGSDTALNRPEAWSMQFDGVPPTLKFIHQPVNHPRAMYYRDLVAKRSLNIKNIKTDTATHGIGNYSKEYEIVQTNARTINNSSFVQAGGYEPGETDSPYVAGMDDYPKPQRGRHAHVFVNRFSCPGGPLTMGDSNGGPGLDVEAAEYSVYNDINYRNWAVREPLRWQLASHVNQFGFYSDSFHKGEGSSSVNTLNYDGTGSIYQVNRNPVFQMKDSGSTTITASVYDNFYVQHAIPQTDKQYAWITSSFISYDTFGYLPYDGDGSLITFSSASDFVSYRAAGVNIFGVDKTGIPALAKEAFPTVYVGLNYNTREPAEYLSSFMGYRPNTAAVVSYVNTDVIASSATPLGTSSLLNAVLLKRNGPYQHPSWKQTRTGENTLVRKWNSSNITAYNLENDVLKIKDDPPVISKYKPLHHILQIAIPKPGGGPDGLSIPDFKDLTIASTYGNEFGLFANRDISYDLNIDTQNDNYRDHKSAYARIKKLYTNGALDDVSNPVQGLKYFSYAQQVYPDAINMYSRRNRERVGYKNTFWRDSRIDRSALGLEKFGGTNSQGYVVSQSCWALDTSEQFGTGLSTYVAESASIGSAGELQNDYTFAYRLVGSTTGDASSLKPGPIYARKHTMGSIFSTVSPTGPEALRSSMNSSTFLMSEELDGNLWPTVATFNDIGHVSVFGGNAEFQAHTQAGFVRDNVFVPSPSAPFYDKYELYNMNMRLKNKDMSLVPAFRIADHIQKYLQDSNGFLAANTGSFTLVGVNEDNTETVLYTNDAGNIVPYSIQTSKDTPNNSSEDDFYRIYSFSDFMQSFDIISDDTDAFVSTDFEKGLTLSCKILKKFIAYDGFYPAERTLDIVQKFSDGYKANITGSTYTKTIPGVTVDTSSYDLEDLKMRPIMQPLFSPGILYNTIKSGIAVDCPFFTEEYATTRYFDNAGNPALTSPASSADYSDYYAIGELTNGKISNRLPFEALLAPAEHLSTYKVYDSEPHPSASLSVYSGIAGTSEDDDYVLIMNNFLGEIPKFFLEGASLTSLESKDDSTDFIFEKDKFYGMRVKMRKSLNKNPNHPGSSILLPQVYVQTTGSTPSTIIPNHKGVYETMTMYSRPSAFGPPMASGLSFTGSYMVPASVPSQQSIPSDSLNGYYLAYTPPYYDGEAWADIMFVPTESRKYELSEIIAQSQVKYWRVDIAGSAIFWPDAEAPGTDYPMHYNHVNDNAMQLSSSLNLFGLEFVEGNNATRKTPKWVIQPKFETPMLNFGDKTKSPYTFENITTPTTSSDPWLGYGGKTTTPVGMWHQFGLIPEKDQGVFMEVSEITPSWLENRADDSDIDTFYNTGSVENLASAVGFGEQSKRLGTLASSKTVYEAVVAIPFVENDNVLRTASKLKNPISTRSFFELGVDMEFSETTNIMEIDLTALLPGMSEDVLKMASNIRDKYVFPPQFDFFRNRSAKPVAMYIFEFEHTFDRDDLSYMWQNIAPKLGNEFQTATSTISHPLLKGNLLEEMRDKVRWMVFKVKQRAETNYYNNVAGAPKQQQQKFGYNWPYDYFSMVEFAKIDSTVSYGDLFNPGQTYLTSSQTGISSTYESDLGKINSTPSTKTKEVSRQAEAQVAATQTIASKKIK
tara:strand:+ start:16663 stop:25575 length:8913 start_codon:yes stop_codon:yes gene_type:complete